MATLSEQERDAWRGLPTTAIADALGRFQVLSSRLRPQTGTGIVAPAYCVRVVVGDSASLHLALESVPVGSVLVVDAGGFGDRAVWGEVLTAAAQQRGVVGAIIDGAIRDVAGIRARQFPIYCAAISSAGPHKAGGGSWGGTVSCGGVTVNTGDLVVADEDGIVVVPWDGRDVVAAAARGILAKEDELIRKLGEGRSSAEQLGLL